MSKTSGLARVDTGADQPLPETIQQVILGGDLSRLSPSQRVAFYARVCESLGLNPLTRPFAYIELQGKHTLYALKGCTDQLRTIRQVSLSAPRGELVDGGTYVVWVDAKLPNGRTDSDCGAVHLGNSTGDVRANLIMKAITKAKRRTTLSICGLGMLDESELSTVGGAKIMDVDPETGEITATATIAGSTTDADSPATQAAASTDVISQSQRRRLFTIATKKGWSKDDLSDMLAEAFGVKSTKNIQRGQYDVIVEAIEQGPPPPADQPF